MTFPEEANLKTARVAPAPKEVARSLGRYAAIRIIQDGSGPASAVVTGELDLSGADALTTALCDAIDASRAGLRLDLSEVAFCDCSTLHSLRAAQAFARTLGRGFALGPHSEAVARVLELTGTLSLLTAPP